MQVLLERRESLHTSRECRVLVWLWVSWK